MEPSGPLAYALGLERHNPTMSTLWFHAGRLEREREIYALYPYLLILLHEHYWDRASVHSLCYPVRKSDIIPDTPIPGSSIF